jgi:hemoglobin/transferrin/lactoferrin receptor protein
VNFRTKTPEWRQGPQASALAKYATGNRERTVHADAQYGKGRWGGLSSLTGSQFGDLQSGRRANPLYPYFWRRDSLVVRQEGEDRVVPNADPFRQGPAGYHQWNLAQKVLFRPNDRNRHLLTALYTTSSDVPRYDRLTQDADGYLTQSDFRHAAWYYGPQRQLVLGYGWERVSDARFWQQLRLKAFFTQLEESRWNRRFGRPDLRGQEERVRTAGLRLDALRDAGPFLLQAGAEAYYDRVRSAAHSRNIDTGERTAAATRYPDGSGLAQAGAYASVARQWAGWQASLGARLSWVGLQASFRDTTFFRFPFRDVRQRHQALTGGLNVERRWKTWRLQAVLSSAFRAPNIDDVGKVFDSRAGASIILPNENLRAERALNAEVGVGRQQGAWAWSVQAYCSWLRGLVQVAPSQWLGQDSIWVDGVLTQVAANRNVGLARIYGLYAQGQYTAASGWGLRASATYTKGQQRSDASRPLGHIPPLLAQVEATGAWKRLGLRWRGFVQYQGWKRWDELANDDEDRPTFAVAGRGYPAWFTLNARLEKPLGRQLTAVLGLDNLLDTHYRTFASGVNGMGRSASLTLRWAYR